MRLSTTDVARRLGLPASTIERWIRQGRIPVIRRGTECLFDPKELEAWASSRNLTFTADPVAEPERERFEAADLLEVMQRGGVFSRLAGPDVAAVLGAAVAVAPVAEEQRPELLERLLEREEMASTGIGRGVAIPHPRTPMHRLIPQPVITTCFLQRPVDYAAIDGLPVFVLFLLLSPAVKVHLHLLSQLAFLLRDDRFIELLRSAPEPEKLWAAVSEARSRLEGTAAR